MPTTVLVVGIFTRSKQATIPTSPGTWAPSDVLERWAVDQLYADATKGIMPLTRDVALRVPGVKRAHGIHVTMFAEIPFFQMTAAVREPVQPKWLTSSASGLSPYHLKFAIGSDLFFNGWACQSFTEDMTDTIHVPFGEWGIEAETGSVIVKDGTIPKRYTRHIAIPMGYGENGLLVDGAETIRQARAIEASYTDRLNNPVPLTVLSIPMDVWQGWKPDERKAFRDQWVKNRRADDGATAMKPDSFGVDMPGAVPVDLFESGRNAVRLDIANQTSTPASMLEGVRQGGSGGGTDIKYTGVANGASRHELWDYGLAKRMVLAYEARMSMDDVSPAGRSIRGDLTGLLAVPSPTTNPTSED